MRIILILLAVAAIMMLIAGCSGSRTRPWTEISDLDALDRTVWEGWLKTLAKYPSDRMPDQNGVWVDNGYGWQGPYSDLRPVPFYLSTFRVIHRGLCGSPWPMKTEGVEIFPSSGVDDRPLIGYGSPGDITAGRTEIGRLFFMDSPDEMTKSFRVEMKTRSDSDLYWVKGDDYPAFVYVDAKSAFKFVQQGGELTGAVRIYDTEGKLLREYPDVFRYLPSTFINLGQKLQTFSVEITMDDSANICSHWATALDDRTIITDSPPIQYWRGWVQVNTLKSTNFSAWFDVYIDPKVVADEIEISVGEMLTVFVPWDRPGQESIKFSRW